MMTDKEIRDNLKKYFIVSGEISIENGLVICTGDVDLANRIPVYHLPVQFKSVDGNFNCSNNLRLSSIAGAPQQVGGDFICHNNPKLESLTGAPQLVGGRVNCINNNLTTLTDAPRVVGGEFRCWGNPLQSLTGAPAFIRGQFLLSCSKNLPLLPLLMIRGVTKFVIEARMKSILALEEIFNRYKNTGTRGMLACAEEMLNAGYGSNANL